MSGLRRSALHVVISIATPGLILSTACGQGEILSSRGTIAGRPVALRSAAFTRLQLRGDAAGSPNDIQALALIAAESQNVCADAEAGGLRVGDRYIVTLLSNFSANMDSILPDDGAYTITAPESLSALAGMGMRRFALGLSWTSEENCMNGQSNADAVYTSGSVNWTGASLKHDSRPYADVMVKNAGSDVSFSSIPASCVASGLIAREMSMVVYVSESAAALACRP